MARHWRHQLINFYLRLFVRPLFLQLANESSLPKLRTLIIRKRKHLDFFALRLPRGARQQNILIEDLTLIKVDTGNTKNRRTILYLHGGGYAIGSAKTHVDLGARLSKACEADVFLVDYRLAPEHSFPAQLDDAKKAYHWLLDSGILPSDIIIAGDSAGGGLAISTLVALRDESVPLPRAGVCLCPLTDLLLTGESLITNKNKDPYIVAPKKNTVYG